MDNLENFLDKIYENASIDSALCINDALVLIPKEVERDIEQNYNKINEGHVLHRPLKIADLQEVLKRMKPNADKEIYETYYEGVGYDFISLRKDIVQYKKLIGYKEQDVLKEDNDKECEVKKAIIPQPLSKFETDTLSMKIRKIQEEVAKEQYPDFNNEASEGRLFILENVHAGKSFIDGKEIPPFSKWRNEYFIAVPEEIHPLKEWDEKKRSRSKKIGLKTDFHIKEIGDDKYELSIMDTQGEVENSFGPMSFKELIKKLGDLDIDPTKTESINFVSSQINESGEKVSNDELIQLINDIGKNKYYATKDQWSLIKRAAFSGLDKKVYDKIKSQTK